MTLRILVPTALLAACATQNLPAETNKVVRANDLSDELQEQLAAADTPWQITIYHARGITGANSVVVPNAFELLDKIVEECRLGQTYLQIATDGVAILRSPRELSSDQAACIRNYEQPGLRLMDLSN